MAWFKKEGEGRVSIPKGLWIKCNHCNQMLYKKEVEWNLSVCPKCNYHFRISARDRIAIMTDAGSFQELDADLEPLDPLGFRDPQKYPDRVRDAQKKTGSREAIVTGSGRLSGVPCMLGVMDFHFFGGSLGSVVGEKIVRLVEGAIRDRLPVVIVSSSGGARMQEGTLSLMQMAKTVAALTRLRREGLPYISLLADPSTGGTVASFATVGDIILAEPRALIGFAGPRVIQQTIKETLPEGFQRSEFLLEHGFIDRIVERRQVKETLAQILSLLLGHRQAPGPRRAAAYTATEAVPGNGQGDDTAAEASD